MSGTIVKTKTGTPDQVRAWLERAHEAGRLVAVTPPVPVAPGSDRIQVTATVLPMVQVEAYARSGRQGQPVRWSVRRRLVVASTVAVLLLGAAGWVAYEIWVYRYVILLVVAGLLAAWVLLGRAGACPGLHCPGCRCGGR